MGLITKDTDYAMRALVYVARHPERTVAAREVSERLDISHSFLRKLMRRLGEAGILNSVKGKNGGSTLAREPERIFVKDLVALFQGKVDMTHCTVKKGPCPNVRTCLLHRKLIVLEQIFKRDIAVLSIRRLLKAAQ